jgi:hypothetical protein
MVDRVSLRAGALVLEGLVERPDGAAAWGGAAFCHPHPLYGGDMHNNVVARVTPAMVVSGLVVLRFNFRGVGRSQGAYAGGEGEQEDLRAALAHLVDTQGMTGKPLFVVGYSFGATVAARAARANPTDVAALVCIALPVGFGDFHDLQRCTLRKLFLAGSEDHICPPPRLRELVGALPGPKALVALDATDHIFHSREAELAWHIVPFLETLRPSP